MLNALTKQDEMLNNTIEAINDKSTSLALRHLDYTLTTEHNRAILTQHAMKDTEYLMCYAAEIMDEVPESAGALEKIMRSYLDATSETIRTFAKHYRR